MIKSQNSNLRRAALALVAMSFAGALGSAAPAAATANFDGLWSVVGSTNFDHRSFGINDEVNLAALDETLAARIEEDFQHDVAASHRVTYDEWSRRSPLERLNEWVGWILERQE